MRQIGNQMTCRYRRCADTSGPNGSAQPENDVAHPFSGTEKRPLMDGYLDVTEKEYQKAGLILARRKGTLRSAGWMMLFSLLLLVVGIWIFPWFQATYLSAVVPLLLCILCPVLLLLVLFIEPRRVQMKNQKQFQVFSTLFSGAQVRLYPDYMETKGESVTLTDPYALIGELVETADLLIFLKDQERMLVLPKRCIPEDQREKTLEFIRLTFVRKRRLMRGWLF